MNLAFVGMAAALGLSAAGSAFGAGYAGMSAIGAWKKCYASGKPAPFIMIAFSGAPLPPQHAWRIANLLLRVFRPLPACPAPPPPRIARRR